MAEVLFLLAAEVDVQAAYEWLEEQREGRGDQFLTRLREVEVLLERNLIIGVRVDSSVRKILVQRFDYGVFYTVEGQRIMVAAVLDLRRDPEFI